MHKLEWLEPASHVSTGLRRKECLEVHPANELALTQVNFLGTDTVRLVPPLLM